MKKFIFILAVAAILTGCASQVSTTNNYSTGKSNRGDESKLDSGLLKSSNQSASADKKMTNRTKINDQLVLEDLAKDYIRATIKTNFGDIKVVFYGDKSPLTVNNFLNLAKSGFYDNTKFHRVIPDFMIQGGDPNSKGDDWSNHGKGGPDYRFADEINDEKLVRGSLAMANTGFPVTNGSQFFIVTAASTPWLDGKHTNFGQVIDGMDVVDKIEGVKTNENDHPTEDVVVTGIEIGK